MLRVKFGPLTIGCKLGPYTINFDVSDPENCTSTYNLTVSGKNTKPVFDPKPPVIDDFTLPVNELKVINITEVIDNENSTLYLTCWRVLVGMEPTVGLISSQVKVDSAT